MHLFTIGDRVVVLQPIHGLKRGLRGTITLVYACPIHIYDVDFDGYGLVRLVPSIILAPASEERL